MESPGDKTSKGDLDATGVGGTGVGVNEGVSDGDEVCVTVGIGEGVGGVVAVAVGVTVGVGVCVGKGVGVADGVGGSGVAVTVGVTPAVGMTAAVGTTAAVGVTATVGVTIGVSVGSGTLVATGGAVPPTPSTRRYVRPPMMQPAYSSAQRAAGSVSAYTPSRAASCCSAPVWSISRASDARAGTVTETSLSRRAQSTRVVASPRLSVTTSCSAWRSSRALIVPA
jgi:hypothetical protein